MLPLPCWNTANTGLQRDMFTPHPWRVWLLLGPHHEPDLHGCSHHYSGTTSHHHQFPGHVLQSEHVTQDRECSRPSKAFANNGVEIPWAGSEDLPPCPTQCIPLNWAEWLVSIAVGSGAVPVSWITRLVLMHPLRCSVGLKSATISALPSTCWPFGSPYDLFLKVYLADLHYQGIHARATQGRGFF